MVAPPVSSVFCERANDCSEEANLGHLKISARLSAASVSVSLAGSCFYSDSAHQELSLAELGEPL